MHNPGKDLYESHREDFKTCPGCDHSMDHKEWDKAATTLVLEPRCYKAGCVTIISECPKCFKPSWVHERMDGFEWNDQWPEDWKVAVEKKEAEAKLAALRAWGASLCHSCKHLASGTVEYHAWRQCIKGSGPAEKTCDKYQKLDSPNAKLSDGATVEKGSNAGQTN